MHTKKFNFDLLKIIISSILFVIGILISNSTLSHIILILSYIVIGYEVIINAFKNIFKGHIFDEFFLMMIATFGAFFIGEFTEAVAVMLLFQLGEYLEDLAVDKSKGSIIGLMNLKSSYANIKVGDNIKNINPEKLNVNDIIVVKPGEKIPVDAVVIDGESTIDTSALTGEAIPRKVCKGNDILSGSINLNGLLTLKVSKKYKESTVSKILNLIENAENKKTDTEKFITKFSKYYTPVVVLCAVLIFVIQAMFLDGDINTWIYRSLSFLVISCPCALVISIPLGFFSGIGVASKYGILIKGSSDLEKLTHVNSIVFDKTGTLTEGVFKVTKVVSDKIPEDELLRLASHAEYFSNHPIATSILNDYDGNIDKSIIKNYEEIAGKGIKVNINKDKILIGNSKLFKDSKIKIDNIDEVSTIIYVARNNEYLGYVIISDVIKKEAKNTIVKLKDLGIKDIAILSGDNSKIVDDVSKKLNIKNKFGALLPQEKLEKLNNLKKENNTVMAVGDGINDALLLLSADIGVSMGNIGSDASIESSDIILIHDNLEQIVTAFNIAKKTKNTVWFNILFALTVKIIVLILSALGITSIWASVFADVGVTLIAILNSIKLLKIRF